jgi:LacI family transcriptional regulator
MVSARTGLCWKRKADGNKEQGYVEALIASQVDGGERAAQSLLAMNPRPTAVFCGNNPQAVGLVMGMRAAGMRIPEDMAICCFDDVELASQLDPFLTVAVQPDYSFGTLATQLVLERIEGKQPPSPRRVVLQPTVIVRRSTTGTRK